MLYKTRLKLSFVIAGAQKGKMKTININELQAQISRVIRNVEKGETYEVMRYSRPVAVIVPKDSEQSGSPEWQECNQKLNKIMEKLEINEQNLSR